MENCCTTHGLRSRNRRRPNSPAGPHRKPPIAPSGHARPSGNKVTLPFSRQSERALYGSSKSCPAVQSIAQGSFKKSRSHLSIRYRCSDGSAKAGPLLWPSASWDAAWRLERSSTGRRGGDQVGGVRYRTSRVFGILGEWIEKVPQAWRAGHSRPGDADVPYLTLWAISRTGPRNLGT